MYVASPPDFDKLISDIGYQRISELGLQIDDRRYLHWDKLRHLQPPDGQTPEEWWLRLKLGRMGSRKMLPVLTTDREILDFNQPDEMQRLLHVVDQQCSGRVAMDAVVTADRQAQHQYLVNSLMEEAIRSSQLEGATTTRKVAKDMLRTGRKPVNRSEKMILNNYRAMNLIREELGEKLTPAAIFALHRVLTEGTLDDPDAAGRMQRPQDHRVAVTDRMTGEVVHLPPSAEELPERLEALCAFANGESVQSDGFIHPVVRSILLHFWLAYDHPFEDGNGRTARALFYWSMRQHEYWLVEYLSISTILREAPAQYSRSFLEVETDSGDLTYFLLAQLSVIEQAVIRLNDYLRTRVAEVKDVERLVRSGRGFNHRQTALLSNAVRSPDKSYTFAGHAGAHGVAHETARTDLLALESDGLLIRRKSGRQIYFDVPGDLAERLKSIGSAP